LVDVAAERDAYPRIPGYEFVRPLARGGRCDAWLARPRASGTEVVLKVVPVGNRDRVPTFHRAIEDALEQPEVFLAADHGTLEGAVYIAYPRLDGLDLSSVLASLDPGRDLRRLADLAARLGRYHRRGWTHGNLKPSNVYLWEGRFATTDFAFHLLCEDRSPGLSPRDDVAALGALGHAIVTRRLSPQAEGPVPLDRTDPQQGKPSLALTMLEELRQADIPEELWAILMLAMSASGGGGYADGSALAEDLERFLCGDAVEAHQPSATTLIRRSGGRIRTRVLVCDPDGVLPSLSADALARFRTHTVRSRGDAGAALAEHPWEAVALTDAMKIEDMLGVFAEVRRLDPDAARLVLCGRSLDPAAIGRLLAEGGVDAVAPLGADDPLGVALETALERPSGSARGHNDEAVRALRRELRVSQLAVQARSADLQAHFDFYESKINELKRTQAAIVKVSTELRQRNAELHEANRRVVELSATVERVRADFFANISHELRTPLTLTIAPLEGMLSGRYGAMPATVAEQVAAMLRHQRQLLGLVNQVLDIAKLDARGITLRFRRVRNVNALVGEAITGFRGLAERKGLELTSDFDPALDDANLFLAPEQFEKVVYNLLANAHKFTARGAVRVTTRLSNGRFELRVTDTGCGIAEADRARIFDRFAQASSGAMAWAGTGIGLSLVKEIAKLHGGSVSVESALGEGSTFLIGIPLGSGHLDASAFVADEEPQSTLIAPSDLYVAAADRDAGDSAADAHDEGSPMDPAKATVLCADDNPQIRRYLAGILRGEFNVKLARDGEDALRKARALKPDLIVSDLMMPAMDGMDLLRAVRSDRELATTPLVIVTANASEDAKLVGLEASADDYLHKPFSEHELLSRIRNLVRLQKQHRRIARDLAAARAIQESLVPALPLVVGPLSFSGFHEPSTELSGDCFDIVQVAGAIYVYVADVTSHGVASAQVTLLLKEMFQGALASRALPLSELAVALQQRYASRRLDLDVSMQLGRYLCSSGTLEVARLGAPAPVVVRAREAQSLGASAAGPALSALSRGTLPDGYPIASVTLAAGSAVYFHTDGVHEFACGDRPFGRRRLFDLLVGVDSDDWASGALKALRAAHGGPAFDDDLTLVRVALAGGVEGTATVQ
jgi:signal transduction histidine kinase/CheY-like chemotaxis protein